MTFKKHFNTAFISALFFISGACGLIYEILWSRYLSDLLGVTSLAQLVVLMVFMGGLSLGAVLVGRLADRGHNGLRYYGWLELGIGFYAIFFPKLFSLAGGIFYRFGVNFAPGSPALLVCKITIAIVLILAPSVAMGGTLPAVIRYLTKSQKGLRRNISLLYGINTLGGVLGVLAGGFFMVHQYGLSRSMLYVGILNIGLGAVALGYERLAGRSELLARMDSPDEQKGPANEQDSRVFRPYAAKRAMAAAGLAGFAAMALQVAWIRYFGIVLGATHSAFTIVVAAFICGLGLGALLVRARLVSRIPLPTLLTLTFALTATTMGLGLFFYVRAPFELARFEAIIEHTPYSWPIHEVFKFGYCFVLMLLPTVASGMTLPLCVRIVGQGIDNVGKDVAVVYAVNTLGCLLGIGVTSQLLFRMMSLPRTLQVIFFIYLGTTIFLLFLLREKGRKRIATLVGVLTLVHLVFWRPWSPESLYVKEILFGRNPPYTFNDFVEDNKRKVVVEARHGAEAQVTVLDVFENADPYRLMFINGKPDASAYRGAQGEDMENQVLTGNLPMLLHEKPEKVFVLGVGSGITSGEVLRFPEVQQVVTAELAAEVFEASKSFAEYNNRFWEDPRHSMVIEDGKTYLQISQENFDVIIMQPTNLWQQGMAGLFSEDFFRLSKSRLAPGGIVAQWLHLYMIDDHAVNIVLKTFSQVFPEASVFKVSPHNILLIGYDDQWRFKPRQFAQRFYRPGILEAQTQQGNVNPAALLLREVMSRASFQGYTRALTSQINTTDFPILERAAEYGHFINPPLTVVDRHDSRLNPDGKGDLLIHDYRGEVGLDLDQMRDLLTSRSLAREDQLRQSLTFMLLSRQWPAGQAFPPLEALSYLYDPQLREIVMHPNYRRAVEQLTANDSFNLLGAELLVWGKTASQLWTPEPQRLYQLYDRFAAEVDQEHGGTVARNAALTLARGGACGAAIRFLRTAEKKGALSVKRLQVIEIPVVFACEVTAGDPQKARYWWSEIEQRGITVTDEMRQAKISLDIKLGGPPPPPVHGRI